MDAAYVKFMLCQCLINRADWGLALGCMNIVYSFFLFQFWSVELFRCLHNYPIKWVLLYGFNIVFNVIVMTRIVKRESISVFYWMCETGALLIFRVHFLYYNEDDFWLAKHDYYHVSNLVIDVYIGLSLLAMIYVICGLRLNLEGQFPEAEMGRDCKFDPEMAKRAAQRHKEEFLAMKEEEEEKQRQLESDLEMEESNRKAALKLAQLEEEEGSLCSLVIAPTAPDEENVYFSDREMEPLKLAQLEEEEGSLGSLEITPTAPDEENVYFSDREMEELNLKFAQLEEEEGFLCSPEITPTAPDEENMYSSIFLSPDFPGPSAPPESSLSIEPDSWYEINDRAAYDDQYND